MRDIYEHYTVTGWSIEAICRWLNEQGVASRKAGARWGPSTVRQMLRNPAYRGTACFGKTRIVRGVARQKRVTRTLRMGGAVPRRDSAPRERPREEWIEIPVPAIVDETDLRAGRRSCCTRTRCTPAAARSSRAWCRDW